MTTLTSRAWFDLAEIALEPLTDAAVRFQSAMEAIVATEDAKDVPVPDLIEALASGAEVASAWVTANACPDPELATNVVGFIDSHRQLAVALRSMIGATDDDERNRQSDLVLILFSAIPTYGLAAERPA